MTKYNGIACVAAENRNVWQQWLEKNHKIATSVWLIIFHKKSGTPSVYYDEAVEEALCFGWIDSKPNKRDENSYYLYMSARKPKSNWSLVNKKKVEILLAQNKIAPAGQAMIDLAKQTGTWDALDVVDALELPNEMVDLFEMNAPAKLNWEAFPKSTKRGILEWIRNAKTPATTTKRIKETVELAVKNIRANQYVADK